MLEKKYTEPAKPTRDSLMQEYTIQFSVMNSLAPMTSSHQKAKQRCEEIKKEMERMNFMPKHIDRKAKQLGRHMRNSAFRALK